MQEGASELGKEKLAIHQKMIKLIPPLPRHLEGAVACMPRHTAPDFVLRGATCNGKTGNFRMTRNPFLRTLNPFIRTLKLPPDPSELSTGADGCMTRHALRSPSVAPLRVLFLHKDARFIAQLHRLGWLDALIRLLVPVIRLFSFLPLIRFTRALVPELHPIVVELTHPHSSIVHGSCRDGGGGRGP